MLSGLGALDRNMPHPQYHRANDAIAAASPPGRALACRRRAALGAGVGLALLLLSGQSYGADAPIEDAVVEDSLTPLDMAQTRTNGRGEALALGVEEARPFEEGWLQRPSSIFAIESRQVDDLDICDLGDMAARIPSLAFSPANLSLQDALSMRGAGSGLGPVETDNSVAFILNGQRLHRVPTISIVPHDIERVEAVGGMGPMLSGSDALGGALSVQLRRPSMHHSFGGARASFGSDEYDLAGLYSKVVTPGEMGVLMSASFSRRTSLFEDASPDLRQERTAYLRGGFIYANEANRVESTVLITGVDRESLGRSRIETGRDLSQEFTSLSPAEALDPFVVFQETADDIRLSNAGVGNVLLGVEYQRTFSEHAFVEYDGLIQITNSLLEYRLSNKDYGTLTSESERSSEYLLQEFRLRLDYPRWDSYVGFVAIGERAFDTDTPDFAGLYFDQVFGGGSADSADDTTDGSLPESLGVGSAVVIHTYNLDTESKKLSFYAQSEYLMGQGFYVQLGTRFTVGKKALGTGVDGENPDFIASRLAEGSNNFVASRLVLGHRSRQRHHFFLKYSLQKVSDSSIQHITETVPRIEGVAEEGTSQVEMGYKSRLSDSNRLSLALYRVYYENRAYSISSPQGFFNENWFNYGFAGVAMVDKATSQGLELLWQYAPSLHFLLDLGAVMSQSSYGLPHGSALPDSAIIHTPPYSYNLRLSGDVPFSGERTFHWLVAYRANGRTRNDILATHTSASSYHLIDTRLLLRFPTDLSLSLWLRNIGDTKWTENAYQIIGYAVSIPGSGRQLQFRVEYTF